MLFSVCSTCCVRVCMHNGFVTSRVSSDETRRLAKRRPRRRVRRAQHAQGNGGKTAQHQSVPHSLVYGHEGLGGCSPGVLDVFFGTARRRHRNQACGLLEGAEERRRGRRHRRLRNLAATRLRLGPCSQLRHRLPNDPVELPTVAQGVAGVRLRHGGIGSSDANPAT